jgi:TolA-binding protein
MKRLWLCGLLISAALPLFGQRKEDFLQVQRDVAALQEQLKTMQKSQDEKLAAIQSMLQQALDSSSRSVTGLAALTKDIDAKLADLQTKLAVPLASAGSKVDQLADEFRAVSTTVGDLRTKINGLDGKLADIKNIVSTIAANQTAPPPPQAASASASNPCASFSADSLWENAKRDKSKGNLELALREYGDYASCFADTANAPVAQYEIGQIYFGNDQFGDAVKAYDAVIEKFPANPKTPDALYYKGVSLMKQGPEHKADAIATLREYNAKYPQGVHVANAHANLKTLGGERPGQKKR